MRDNRYRLGEILHRYRVAVVRHGAWLPACKVIGRYLGKTERTVRAIAADYARIKRIPAAVIAELERADIDPAKKRNQKVVEIAQQLNQAGIEPEQAVGTARARQQRRLAASVAASGEQRPTATPEPMTDDEKRILKERNQIRKGLEQVPENRKVDILLASVAEEM